VLNEGADKAMACSAFWILRAQAHPMMAMQQQSPQIE